VRMEGRRWGLGRPDPRDGGASRRVEGDASCSEIFSVWPCGCVVPSVARRRGRRGGEWAGVRGWISRGGATRPWFRAGGAAALTGSGGEFFGDAVARSPPRVCYESRRGCGTWLGKDQFALTSWGYEVFWVAITFILLVG
jgi:hypothetical protein